MGLETSSRRYAVISPVRNEAEFIRRTLESVTSQTEPPAVWVIVDDGSTDDTARIVGEFARTHDYIHLFQPTPAEKEQPSDRLLWAAEAIAFNAGLATLDIAAYDYIVKLDGDLAFGPEYFAALMDEFERDPALGMAGGYCYRIKDDQRILEWNPASHVRGPTKMYRRECFVEIGGIPTVYAWDALDELIAQRAGWRTQSFDLVVDHLKETGTVGGLLNARLRMGKGAYLLGYHPAFLVVRAGRLALGKPYVVGGLAFLAGWAQSAIARPERITDEETMRYLRRQQMARLRGIGDGAELRSLLDRAPR